jgi:hypothetical protein
MKKTFRLAFILGAIITGTLLGWIMPVVHAQTGAFANPLLQPPFAYPNSTIQLNIVFIDSTPTPSGITVFSWILNLPAGVTAGTPVAAAPPGSTMLQCISNTNCNAVSTFPFLNGTVATVPLTISATPTFGSFPVSLTVDTASANLATNPVNLNISASSGTTPWFSIVSGKTTCRVSKVAQIPIRLSYLCFNIYGATAGSYTADPAGGLIAPITFLIGLNDLGNDSAFCMITVNSTSQTVTIPTSFPPRTILPNSAIYLCGANSMSGPGSVGWP